ncbi:MAG: pyridoxal 5'-phosphate synthase [Acidimicrobiales bacterium]
MPLLAEWMRRAEAAGVLYPNAIALATASSSGVVSARTVILKAFDDERLIFESESYSRKGVEIAENPRVALTLHWREVHRQICITGIAATLPVAVSDEMWAARARPNQAASVVAREGATVDSVAAELDLHSRADALASSEDPIARPATYQAYGVVPTTVEFWEGSADRLHRRVFYERESPGSQWSWSRIQP